MMLYCSGPISGMPDANRPAFTRAAAALRQAGYTVVNPHELQAAPASWETAMRVDLKALVECDGVAILPGWGWSRGAQLELVVATELGMRVQAWEDWVAEGTVTA